MEDTLHEFRERKFRERIVDLCEQRIDRSISTIFKYSSDDAPNNYYDWFLTIRKGMIGGVHTLHAVRQITYPDEIMPLLFLLNNMMSLYERKETRDFNTESFVSNLQQLGKVAEHYTEQLKECDFKRLILANLTGKIDSIDVRMQSEKTTVLKYANITRFMREPWEVQFANELKVMKGAPNPETMLHSKISWLDEKAQRIQSIIANISLLQRTLNPLLQGLPEGTDMPPETVVLGPNSVKRMLTQHNLAAKINDMSFSQVLEMGSNRLAVSADPHTGISDPVAFLTGLSDMLASYDNNSEDQLFMENLSTVFQHADQGNLTRHDIDCIKAAPGKLKALAETFKTARTADSLKHSDQEYQADTRIIAAAIIYLADTMEPIAVQAKRTIFVQK